MKTIINKALAIKINDFLKKSKSLKFLDPNIFGIIDGYKEISDISFNDYYLEYISNLPNLDFENVVRISREVYQLYGKENEFDEILEKLMNNYCIGRGSLNKEDENCIINASESRILLSGTYYDVILFCHEIGHKLRSGNYTNQSDMMDSFFFETPSIILELAANDYLRDNYGIDINADELRKKHILSIQRESCVGREIFLSIINMLKERKLNVLDLYIKFITNGDFMEYLNQQGTSINTCVDEGISSYSYDIGYILSRYIKNSNNKIEILNMILDYKDNGINKPFTIDENMISGALEGQKYTK